MLRTIVMLGRALTDDPLRTIVDKTNAKHVFVIKMDNNCKYIGLTVEDNEGEERYLYKREMGGLPGKFITGRIGVMNLKNLKKNLQELNDESRQAVKKKALEEIDDFRKKKIAWVQKPSILENRKAIEKIPPKSAILLKSIVQEVIRRQDEIMKEISDLVLHANYGDILLTVRVGIKYLADIEGFSELLKIAAQGEESNTPSNVAFRCMICNQQGTADELKEPLPFFTLDKPNFIPDGIQDNLPKVFPLCRNCYSDLQKGTRYVQEKLTFNIPRTSRASKLWLWIIPQLNDPYLVQEYVKGTGKDLASFKRMLQLAQHMETARDIDLSRISDTESESNVGSFLTYIALFHTYDKQKHMRLISSADGIYPSRLKELSKAKETVDKISSNDNNLTFHFGLITDFIEKENDGWMKTMAYVMSSIFTKKLIDELFIAEILLSKAKSALSRRQWSEWYQIMLKATLILEYLHEVGILSKTNNNQIDAHVLPADDKASGAARFLDSHQNILYTKNLRAICAVGIAVGVIVKAQQRYLGSDSFVSRLNRLEMDYPRLNGLFPQTLPKLKHYKAEEYNDLFAHLGANEISNLDPKQQIQKELMNLVFAVGMSYGFTIGPKKGAKSQ